MTPLHLYLAQLQRFGIRLGLERIRALLQSADQPQNTYPIILVGGTNGKGSTCEFLVQMLARDGLRVGLFTSPHLYAWNERIRVPADGRNAGQSMRHTSTHVAHELFPGAISDRDLDTLFNDARPHLELVAARHGQPTEFETVTFLGLWHFARVSVDVAVVEVGLGGTWDATNIVEPLISVITHVALDHCDRLGSTVEHIARDKAGIARANRVLVTAETNASVLQILRQECDDKRAHLWPFRAPEFSNDRKAFEQTLTRFPPDFLNFTDGASDHNATDTQAPREDTPDATPSFQRLNEATALMARAAWLDCGAPNRFARDDATRDDASFASEKTPHEYSCSASLQDSALQNSLPQVPGRAEVLRLEPRVLIDGANNPDGAACLATHLRELLKDSGENGKHEIDGEIEIDAAASRLILVLGILEDKDWRAMIAALAPSAHRIIATQSDSPRAALAAQIAQAARRHVALVETIVPVSRAVERALQVARAVDIVCICGSFYTIAEVDREAVRAWPRNLFVHPAVIV